LPAEVEDTIHALVAEKVIQITDKDEVTYRT
jgi:hypothetical protein